MGSSNVTTKEILRLLEEGEPEEICAASIILGTLRPTGPQVLRTLLATFERVDAGIQPYVLDAIGRLGTPKALRAVVPLLSSTGVLREQAQRILGASDDRVLPELRSLAKNGDDPTVRLAITRALAALATEGAIELLVELLETAGFEESKAIVGTVRVRAQKWTSKVRRHLGAQLVAGLKTQRFARNETAEIAAVKILALLRDPRAITPLLERLSEDQLPVLRFNALDALAEIKVPAARVARVADRVRPLLDPDHARLAAAALRVLRRLDPPVLTLDELLLLSRTAHPDIAQVALRDLARFSPDAVSDSLLDGLLNSNEHIQHAAASALADVEGILDQLLKAHGDPRFERQRELLERLIGAKAETLPATRRDALLLELDFDAPEDEVRRRLLVLAALDRGALNRFVEARATEALTTTPPSAVKMLEPLVRNRIASPSGRYLLAIAHVLIASESADSAAHWERSLHLFGPLARIADFNLTRHLTQETRLTDDQILALTERLAGRAAPERSVAARVAERRSQARES